MWVCACMCKSREPIKWAASRFSLSFPCKPAQKGILPKTQVQISTFSPSSPRRLVQRIRHHCCHQIPEPGAPRVGHHGRRPHPLPEGGGFGPQADLAVWGIKTGGLRNLSVLVSVFFSQENGTPQESGLTFRVPANRPRGILRTPPHQDIPW